MEITTTTPNNTQSVEEAVEIYHDGLFTFTELVEEFVAHLGMESKNDPVIIYKASCVNYQIGRPDWTADEFFLALYK